MKKIVLSIFLFLSFSILIEQYCIFFINQQIESKTTNSSNQSNNEFDELKDNFEFILPNKYYSNNYLVIIENKVYNYNYPPQKFFSCIWQPPEFFY